MAQTSNALTSVTPFFPDEKEHRRQMANWIRNAHEGRQRYLLSATGSVVTTLWKKFQSFPRVQDFGAKGDGSADDTTSIQKALNSDTQHIILPAGIYNISDTLLKEITTTGKRFCLIGQNPANTIISSNIDKAFLELRVSASSVNASVEILGIGFRGNFSAAAARTNNSGLLISGDNVSFLQYSSFHHLNFLGTYAGIKVTKGARSTSFGAECNLDWCSFTKLMFTNFSHQVEYGAWFTTGSGTGTSFQDARAKISSTGSALRFGGAGNVVGDILLSNWHISQALNGLTIDDSTTYRTNISILGNQFDAGVANAYNMSEVGSAYARLSILGNNYGGNTTSVTPMSEFSHIDMERSNEVKLGKEQASIASGSSAISLFKVTASTFGAVTVNMNAHGLVGGVAAGNIVATVNIRTTNVSATYTIASAVSFPAALYSVSATTSAMTTSIVLKFSATGSGSYYRAFATSNGYKYKIEKL